MPMVPDNGPYPWEEKPDLARRETEYLVFEEIANPGKKTRLWVVRSRQHGDSLGTIAWFGRWRQYVIHAHATFNRGYLADIDTFIKDAMDDWKESRAGASATGTASAGS